MCAITGFLNYGQKVPYTVLLHLIKELTVAAECRGTDATGISYANKGSIVTYKDAKRARDMSLLFPLNTTAAICHNRMTTKGNELLNYNNHPFEGVAEIPFALAHNGVLYNDEDLRIEHNLPDTEIETDSYIAVQLLEEQGHIGFDSLKAMAEELEGSFTITVLDAKNNLWLVKGSNPLHLVHFPELGLYVYGSTKEIVDKALKKTRLKKHRREVIDSAEGDIIHIDRNGNLQRGKFTPKEDEWDRYYSSIQRLYGTSYDNLDWMLKKDDIDVNSFDANYAALIDICGYYGLDEYEVDYLLEMGYSLAEIEELAMNPSQLEEALAS